MKKSFAALLAVLCLGATGCKPRHPSCAEGWLLVNECVASKAPEGYVGPCVYLLPEGFRGAFSCEGARQREDFEEYCKSGRGPSAELLNRCAEECAIRAQPASSHDYLELAADTAACLKLAGWPQQARWEPEWIAMRVGESREARLRIEESPPFPIAFSLTLPPEDENAISIDPPVAVFTPGSHFVTVTFTSVAETATTVSARYDDNPDEIVEAYLPVIASNAQYECRGTAEGIIGPGKRLEVLSSSSTDGLEGAYLRFPPDESLPEIAAMIACAPDITVGPYTPIGPAVLFAAETFRFNRELGMGVPVNPALIHREAAPGQVVLFYEGPSVSSRRVLVANKYLRVDETTAVLDFMAPRLGTYQAAIDPMAGKRSMTRRFTFRGIVGVSMGAAGASAIGLRNHNLFDFIAPLGGPSNWTVMLNYMLTYHLGGFCADGDPRGTIGEDCPPPPPTSLFEFPQEFEKWFYPDGWKGQGGTFTREDYCQIFRDIAKAFGNPLFYNEDSSYLPPGLTPEWLKLSWREKCASGAEVVLEGFYDRRYNPTGLYPVITFCDGADWVNTEGESDIGRWDPQGNQYYPLDIALAVDVNRNGRRDSGEPVIFQAFEPFDDVGRDGFASPLEAGYDPVRNPDPSGDDFDYQYNPSGTEGNYLYDEGEPFLDYGLDGVEGTPQQEAGGFDWGEGNGKFDYNPNVLNLWAHDAMQLLRSLSDEDLRRIDIMADAGIRDLFNFAPGINAMMGVLSERGLEVNMWRNFASLYGGGDDFTYDSTRVDYLGQIGKNFVILYGNPDASPEELQEGDGGHVGTPSQVLSRLITVTMAMSARWPGGDRKDANPDIGSDYLLTFDFASSSTGRISQVSVFLPPGYHDPSNSDVYYPVIYFLHGYGQEPNDLILSAIFFGSNMISDEILPEDRMQKFIMVFPDGRCRFEEDSLEWERECLKGSFYVDSRWRLDGVRGPQMERIFLELVEYIDATYRTKASEEHVVYY